jgi:transcriptional regulator with XRE-family HTH domain
MTPAEYDDLLAANLRAERARIHLDQASVVEQMRGLGFTTWHRQTLGNVERGGRRLLASEIFGLAMVLNTSVRSLMGLTPDGFPPL